MSSRAGPAVLILLLTLVSFAAMGYHPGLEDDGVYLSAVKHHVNPALYPHDSQFFRLQTQATGFDEAMAGFVRLTDLPVSWAELLWQLLSLYVILWAAHRILQRLFFEEGARWAGVALLGAMFTLPVAGTALNVADPHLHPRNLATALILVAVERTLARKGWQACGLLLGAVVVHPIMGAFGVSFCSILGVVLADRFYLRLTRLAGRQWTQATAASVLSWIFEPPTPDWRRALNTRTYYFLYQWAWYEWLGALGPLVLFWILWRFEERRMISLAAGTEDRGATAAKVLGSFATRGSRAAELSGRRNPQERPLVARFAFALVLYGGFQQCVAMVLLAPPALIRLTPLQPMRFLHLEYSFLVLIAGGLFGSHVLSRSAWRWALFLIVINGGMFLAAKVSMRATEHLEFPGRPTRNAWLEAFEWIRINTPRDAYFALDPGYLAVPGEDYHSFRALAERSQLADALKDAAVVTQVPELAPVWARQVDALAGWNEFQLSDFERLKSEFGVGWVLLSYPLHVRLSCIWHNESLAVCKIPDLGWNSLK